MYHAPEHKNYNTFQVFEDIYHKDKNSRYDQLEMPEFQQSKSPFWFWLSFLLFIIIAGLSIHPLLSYALKTPYPLIVISDQTMQPSLAPSDMVVIAGVINKDQIKINDIIAYRHPTDKTIITVKRVEKIDNNQLIIKGDSSISTQTIYFDQIVGKLIGRQKPFKIPLIGKILLARK